MGPQNIAPAENLIKNDEVVLFICEGNITHTGIVPQNKHHDDRFARWVGISYISYSVVVSCFIQPPS